MTKSEFVAAVAARASTEKNAVAKSDVETIMEAVFAQIVVQTQLGERLQVPHFGTFVVKTRKARQGRNPKTGEMITIPESQRLTFKPTKSSK